LIDSRAAFSVEARRYAYLKKILLMKCTKSIDDMSTPGLNTWIQYLSVLILMTSSDAVTSVFRDVLNLSLLLIKGICLKLWHI